MMDGSPLSLMVGMCCGERCRFGDFSPACGAKTLYGDEARAAIAAGWHFDPTDTAEVEAADRQQLATFTCCPSGRCRAAACQVGQFVADADRVIAAGWRPRRA